MSIIHEVGFQNLETFKKYQTYDLLIIGNSFNSQIFSIYYDQIFTALKNPA